MKEMRKRKRGKVKDEKIKRGRTSIMTENIFTVFLLNKPS